MRNNQIEVFKYSGLKNSRILLIKFLTSFLIGFFIVEYFIIYPQILKNLLRIKNNYTSDDKYLAVITNNGLWIKDNINGGVNIINASKIEDKFLVEASITELDSKFNVIRHIETDKIDISNNSWKIFNPSIYALDKKPN